MMARRFYYGVAGSDDSLCFYALGLCIDMCILMQLFIAWELTFTTTGESNVHVLSVRQELHACPTGGPLVGGNVRAVFGSQSVTTSINKLILSWCLYTGTVQQANSTA